LLDVQHFVTSIFMHTHSKIIDDLGGPTFIGKSLGLTSHAVSQWRKRGIPAKRFPEFVEFAKKCGKKIDILELYPVRQ